MMHLCTNDALMMHWWCADDALIMHRWYTDDALMMNWWGADEALVMCWWCTEDAQMMHCQCTDDALLMHGWCGDDALMMLCWCTADALMMHWWCASIIFDILESSSFQKYSICHEFCAVWWYDDLHMMIWWSSYEDMMMMPRCQDHILTVNILVCMVYKQGKKGLLSQWTVGGWVSQLRCFSQSWILSDFCILCANLFGQKVHQC